MDTTADTEGAIDLDSDSDDGLLYCGFDGGSDSDSDDVGPVIWNGVDWNDKTWNKRNTAATKRRRGEPSSPQTGLNGGLYDADKRLSAAEQRAFEDQLLAMVVTAPALSGSLAFGVRF